MAWRCISTKRNDLFRSRNNTQVLKLDSATNQTNLIGSIYNGSAKYAGGVLAPNGIIYFTPLVSGKYLN
jgi:hypothetical protein